MEAACSWCKKHTHVLGTGLNQVVGSGSNEFGVGFWLWGLCEVGSGIMGKLELCSRPEWTEKD